MTEKEQSNQQVISCAKFQDFVEKLPTADLITLPINHIASVSLLDTFIGKQTITTDYLVEKCEVFGEHLLYLFYGKPAFRLSDKSAYPICLVFKSIPSEPCKGFPFDSGAYFHGRMSKYFDSLETKLEDFTITPNYEIIKKIIKYFFGTNGRYYDGLPLTNTVNPTIPAVDGYISMINDDDSEYLDQRKSSIELIFDKQFKLNENNLEMIIIPEVDFIISGAIIDFNQLRESLTKDFGCIVKSYGIKTVDPESSSYPQITKIVKNYIINFM